MRRAFLTLLAFCWCSIAQAAELIPSNWQSTHYKDNPLIGKIFDDKGGPITPDQLSTALGADKVLLLGEIHDNPDHHQIQASLINIAASKRKLTSVVFEMIPRSYGRRIGPLDLTKDPQLDQFAKRMRWEERGWYSWDIYRPLVLAAVKSGAKIFPGNIRREVIQSIAKKGISEKTKHVLRGLVPIRRLSPPLKDSLRKELEDSHCGMMTGSALPNMALLQRLKDTTMATALLATAPKKHGVLIAGNGHIRKDRGVPYQLPKESSLSIALLEVSDNAILFSDYAVKNEQGDPLYDFVVFTPKFDITDHCAAFKNKVKKKTP